MKKKLALIIIGLALIILPTGIDDIFTTIPLLALLGPAGYLMMAGGVIILLYATGLLGKMAKFIPRKPSLILISAGLLMFFTPMVLAVTQEKFLTIEYPEYADGGSAVIITITSDKVLGRPPTDQYLSKLQITIDDVAVYHNDWYRDPVLGSAYREIPQTGPNTYQVSHTMPNRDMHIVVKAWAQDGTISSQGFHVKLTPEGQPQDSYQPPSDETTPEEHIGSKTRQQVQIVGGVLAALGAGLLAVKR